MTGESAMQFARTVRFDESDENVFHRAAQPGEWAVSGGFEFSNWSDADISGKSRQAFTNGWLGLESFGRASVVAVVRIEAAELDVLERCLAEHFVEVYGAPSLDAALPVARQEIEHMRDLCEDQAVNTILVVHRELTESGVREQYRSIRASEAELVQVAVHGDAG